MKKEKDMKKNLRTLTKKEKAEIFFKMDWEGGLVSAMEHGFIFEMVEGTALEEPLQKLIEALQVAKDALEAEGLEEAAEELGEPE